MRMDDAFIMPVYRRKLIAGLPQRLLTFSCVPIASNFDLSDFRCTTLARSLLTAHVRHTQSIL